MRAMDRWRAFSSHGLAPELDDALDAERSACNSIHIINGYSTMVAGVHDRTHDGIPIALMLLSDDAHGRSLSRRCCIVPMVRPLSDSKGIAPEVVAMPFIYRLHACKFWL